MKKILLSASLLMLSTAAFAVTDGQTYEMKKGLTCENLWVVDRIHTEALFETFEISGTTSPSAVADGKYIYAATTTRTINADAGTACIEVFDFFTGEYVKTVDLKLNGEAFTGLLVANSIGIDEYGNLWVGSLVSNSDGAGSALVYTCDIETGELTSVGELPFYGAIGRIDYYDVCGDITGKEAGGTIMAVTTAADLLSVFNWRREQGADTWSGGWDDGSIARDAVGTYPADQTGFSTGAVLKIVRPTTDGVVEMFYIDGFTTLPALYNSDGSMSETENFGNVDYIRTEGEEGSEVTVGTIPAPTSGANGVVDGKIAGQNFVVYALEQYASEGEGHAHRAVVTAVDENIAFSSMEYMWTIPADGLGGETSGGRRMHCLQILEGEPDAAGRECGYIVTFKEGNGMGVFRIAEEGYGSVEENFVANANITVNGDVIAVSEVAESIEVYNVAGQMVGQVENASEIAAPATGLYIVKAVVEGAPVVKKVIIK